MDEDRIRKIAMATGLSEEEYELADLEVTAATVEAEEAFRTAARMTEEESGRKSFVDHDGERYVSIGVLTAVLSGMAKGFLPEVMQAMILGDSLDPYVEGRLAGVNTCMTIFGAVVAVGKEGLEDS